MYGNNMFYPNHRYASLICCQRIARNFLLNSFILQPRVAYYVAHRLNYGVSMWIGERFLVICKC